MQSKVEENAQKMEQEIQQREGVLRQELQQRDEVLHQQLKRYEQEVIEKNAKIAHLESELSGMIPSSEPPIEVKYDLLYNATRV